MKPRNVFPFPFHWLFFKAICSRFNVLEACCLFVKKKKHNISPEESSRFVNETTTTKLLFVLLLHHAINFARNFHWESFQHFSFRGRLTVTTHECQMGWDGKWKALSELEQLNIPGISITAETLPRGEYNSTSRINTTVNLERSLNARS